MHKTDTVFSVDFLFSALWYNEIQKNSLFSVRGGKSPVKEYFVSPEDDLQGVLDRAEPGSLVHLAAGEYRQKLMIRTR